MRQPLLPGWGPKPIIGMVHLLPLPGSPHWGGSISEVLAAAVRDAKLLEEGGVDAIIVENYGDTPFYPGTVPPATLASLTAAVLDVVRAVGIPVGVNVLRNDAAAALAVCAATGANFIRVNVHTGAMLTDQGWISGAAHDTVRLRSQLGSHAGILADVFVKHATPPSGLTIEDAARDTIERGHADALVVSGSGTGQPTDAQDIQRVKQAVPGTTVLIGSGVTLENANELLRIADGAIVGSSLKQDGKIEAPVSLDRVRQLMDVVRRVESQLAREK
jgi:uncharacterized protein